MVVVVAVVLSVAELEVSLFSVVVGASVHKNYFCFVMKKVQNSMGTIKVDNVFFSSCCTIVEQCKGKTGLLLNQVIKVESNTFLIILFLLNYLSFIYATLTFYSCNMQNKMKITDV